MAGKHPTNPKYSKKYRLTNWPEYNRSLVQRDNFRLLISPDVLDSWKHVASKRKRGGRTQYSNQAIDVNFVYFSCRRIKVRIFDMKTGDCQGGESAQTAL